MSKLYYKHYRHKNFDEILPHGGTTISMVVFPNRLEIGLAICSKKDIFCKKIGRDIADYRRKKETLTVTKTQILTSLIDYNPDIKNILINHKNQISLEEIHSNLLFDLFITCLDEFKITF